MSKTFNEHAYKFYQEGLTLLQNIKANTDEIIDKEKEIICMQEETLKRLKMANIHLDTMTELRLDENDVD